MFNINVSMSLLIDGGSLFLHICHLLSHSNLNIYESSYPEKDKAMQHPLGLVNGAHTPYHLLVPPGDVHHSTYRPRIL